MPMKRMTFVLAVAVFAASAAMAADNNSPPRDAAGPQAKLYYDSYEPAQRMRLRRETCMRTEQSVGAFCVKACQVDYVAVEGRPIRCRSMKPLPPGHFPGPMRKEMDVQTRPATPPGKSENPKHGV